MSAVRLFESSHFFLEVDFFWDDDWWRRRDLSGGKLAVVGATKLVTIDASAHVLQRVVEVELPCHFLFDWLDRFIPL